MGSEARPDRSQILDEMVRDAEERGLYEVLLEPRQLKRLAEFDDGLDT